MPAFKMQFDAERYRIVAPDGTGGDVMEYGDIAQVEYRGKTYIACVDFPEAEGEGFESVLGEDWVYMLTPQHADEENVEFEDPELDVTEDASGDGEGDTVKEEGEDEDEDEEPSAA